jgi:hypothetical protein
MHPPAEEKGRFRDGATVIGIGIVVHVAALLIIRVAVTGGN